MRILLEPSVKASESHVNPLKIDVVNTIERDETPEEAQKRIAQAEEEKKKAGKKAPPSIV